MNFLLLALSTFNSSLSWAPYTIPDLRPNIKYRDEHEKILQDRQGQKIVFIDQRRESRQYRQNTRQSGDGRSDRGDRGGKN